MATPTRCAVAPDREGYETDGRVFSSYDQVYNYYRHKYRGVGMEIVLDDPNDAGFYNPIRPLPDLVADLRAEIAARWVTEPVSLVIDIGMLTARGRGEAPVGESPRIRLVPSGDGRIRTPEANAGALFPRAKPLREVLTPAEQAEFAALQAKFPDWMPRDGLDTRVNIRSAAENAAARAEVEGKGHHRQPLKFGGKPNPKEGLVQTGETLTQKNPTHTEITNFWGRVLRRIQSQPGNP